MSAVYPQAPHAHGGVPEAFASKVSPSAYAGSKTVTEYTANTCFCLCKAVDVRMLEDSGTVTVRSEAFNCCGCSNGVSVNIIRRDKVSSVHYTTTSGMCWHVLKTEGICNATLGCLCPCCCERPLMVAVNSSSAREVRFVIPRKQEPALAAWIESIAPARQRM